MKTPLVVLIMFCLLLSMAASARLMLLRDGGAGASVVIPPAPPQAQAVGYTTNAFDGDMTKGFDVACDNPSFGGAHQWYLGANRTMAASCANLQYPHTDETDGSTVLDIFWGPGSRNGAILDRVGIATSDKFGANQTSFPLNAYYECTKRFDSYSISHMPLWAACWMAHANPAVINGSDSLGVEFDLTEFHGGYPNNQELAGSINWTCRFECYGMAWFGNAKDFIPTYDPTQFHRYGWLLYQTGVNPDGSLNLAGKAYIDDVLVNEGNIQLKDGPETLPVPQRNYLVIHLNGGCNFDEGGMYCANVPILGSVYADGSGNTRVNIGASGPQVFNNTFFIGITGVEGVTSPINGNWRMDCTGPCTDFGIYDTVTNAPIPFSGTYTLGTGILNEWNDTDKRMHVYVKNFRVWSCATWATTSCCPPGITCVAP